MVESIVSIVPGNPAMAGGKYVLIFDPVDGSSNIAANVSVGTIFSIYRRKSPLGAPGVVEDCLQPGRDMVAAGYVLYGSSTMLVYSTGEGVHGFTLDPSVGEFLLSHPNIQVPSPGQYYSVNHGRHKYWSPGIRHFVAWLQALEDNDRSPLENRYIGSMIADFHRNLLRGGIFLYPADERRPDGKLRLTYEAQPLAFIAAQAGAYIVEVSDSHSDSTVSDAAPLTVEEGVPVAGLLALASVPEVFVVLWARQAGLQVVWVPLIWAAALITPSTRRR